MANLYKLIALRNKRLNKIANELGRTKIWNEELTKIFLESANDDFLIFSYLLNKK